MLEWKPQGEQIDRFTGGGGKTPAPVDPDILLVKLRPKQVSYAVYFTLTELTLGYIGHRLSLFRAEGYRDESCQMVPSW